MQTPVCTDDRRGPCTAKNASICLRATTVQTAERAMCAQFSPRIPVSWLKRARRGMACWRTCYARTISPSSPPTVAVIGLRFATLGGKYPRPDFHRLDVRHARHTWKDGFAILWANPLFSKKQAMLTDKTNNKNDKAFLIPQLLAMNHKNPL